MEQRKTPLLDAIVDYTTDRPYILRFRGTGMKKGSVSAGDSGRGTGFSGLI